jgi:hypothetical protein
VNVSAFYVTSLWLEASLPATQQLLPSLYVRAKSERRAVCGRSGLQGGLVWARAKRARRRRRRRCGAAAISARFRLFSLWLSGGDPPNPPRSLSSLSRPPAR